MKQFPSVSVVGDGSLEGAIIVSGMTIGEIREAIKLWLLGRTEKFSQLEFREVIWLSSEMTIPPAVPDIDPSSSEVAFEFFEGICSRCRGPIVVTRTEFEVDSTPDDPQPKSHSGKCLICDRVFEVDRNKLGEWFGVSVP